MASTRPDSECSAGRTSPRAESAPSPSAKLIASIRAILLGQGQHSQVGMGQFPHLPGDRGQHLVRVGPGQQGGGDLGVGLHPLLLPAGGVVEPGVLDRDTGRGAQRDQDSLVILGERAAALLLGQVQVAEDLIADADRDPEEGLHRRVPLGETRRIRAGRDVREAERAGITDEQPEQPAPFRPVVDLADAGLVQAHRHEFGQPLPFADHAQGAVLRVHQPDGRLDDPLQRALQVQARADRDDRFQQAMHPVAGRQDRLQPRLQLQEQLVHLKLRQHAMITSRRFHRATLSDPHASR